MIQIAAPLSPTLAGPPGRPILAAGVGFAQLLAAMPSDGADPSIGLAVAPVPGNAAPAAAGLGGNALPTTTTVVTAVAVAPAAPLPIASPIPAPATPPLAVPMPAGDDAADQPMPLPTLPTANPRPPRQPATLDDTPPVDNKTAAPAGKPADGRSTATGPAPTGITQEPRALAPVADRPPSDEADPSADEESEGKDTAADEPAGCLIDAEPVALPEPVAILVVTPSPATPAPAASATPTLDPSAAAPAACEVVVARPHAAILREAVPAPAPLGSGGPVRIDGSAPAVPAPAADEAPRLTPAPATLVSPPAASPPSAPRTPLPLALVAAPPSTPSSAAAPTAFPTTAVSAPAVTFLTVAVQPAGEARPTTPLQPRAAAAPIPAAAARGAGPTVGTTAPAAQLFAAAISAVDRQDRGAATAATGGAPRPRDGALPAPLGDVLSRLLGSAGPAPVAATAAGDQPRLDLADHRWPTAMIDRIEQLRDAADAGSARIRVVPDALGSIDVTLRRHDDGTVAVRLDADQPATRALLADAAPDLSRLADSRGIRLVDQPGSASGLGSSSLGGSAAGPGGDWRGQEQRPYATPARPTRAATADTDQAEAADGRVA